MENHQTSALEGKILLFCILSASGLLVAQSASALKIQSPPSTLRMTANVSHDILLDHAERVSAKHLAEAVQYRALDRNYWQ